MLPTKLQVGDPDNAADPDIVAEDANSESTAGNDMVEFSLSGADSEYFTVDNDGK